MKNLFFTYLPLSLTVEHLKVLMVEHPKGSLTVEYLKVLSLTVEPAYASLTVEPLPVLTIGMVSPYRASP